MPLYSYVETENSVVPMGIVLGKRLKTLDKRTIIPTHRGKNELLFLRFKSGDFIVCDFNHQLVSGNPKSPKVEKVKSGLRNKVLLSPLHKRVKPKWLQLFKSSKNSLALLKSVMKFDKEVFNNNKNIATAFWKLAISRHWFSLNTIEMSRIRSLASIYGFNVDCSKESDRFKVVFRRKKRAKFDYMFSLSEELVEVGSCTALQGFQMYPTQGFLNKNTGGDLIRISLVKIFLPIS